jgi:hypothetical protein
MACVLRDEILDRPEMLVAAAVAVAPMAAMVLPTWVTVHQATASANGVAGTEGPSGSKPGADYRGFVNYRLVIAVAIITVAVLLAVRMLAQ